jgi:hypothetical protein
LKTDEAVANVGLARFESVTTQAMTEEEEVTVISGCASPQ